jgi:haloacid dehalogenase-like hydrolase
VGVKILTGDNDIIARKICRAVGVPTDDVLLGREIDRLTDQELAQRLEKVTVCAKVSPAQKARIVEALHLAGHVVGFLGDGINDTLGFVHLPDPYWLAVFLIILGYCVLAHLVKTWFVRRWGL